MNKFDHQDWTHVNVGRGTSIAKQLATGQLKKEIIAKSTVVKNKQTSTGMDARVIENTEIGTLPTATHDLAQQIQQARMAKKLTQVQLNQACNFTKGTVGDYESSRAIVNVTELQKMSKILGTILKKPKN
jgi:ribosome-binding protein aMBF1 (putative translation factor)